MIIVKSKRHLVVAVLLVLGLLGMTTGTTFAQSVSTHSTTRTSLGSLHALHALQPANSGGGCQYSSEEIVEVCISESGSTIIGDAYLSLRISNCMAYFHLVVTFGYQQWSYDSARNCSNVLGWLGNITQPAGSAGTSYALNVSIYVGPSYWVDGWSPTLVLCC